MTCLCPPVPRCPLAGILGGPDDALVHNARYSTCVPLPLQRDDQTLSLPSGSSTTSTSARKPTASTFATRGAHRSPRMPLTAPAAMPHSTWKQPTAAATCKGSVGGQGCASDVEGHGVGPGTQLCSSAGARQSSRANAGMTITRTAGAHFCSLTVHAPCLHAAHLAAFPALLAHACARCTCCSASSCSWVRTPMRLQSREKPASTSMNRSRKTPSCSQMR